MVQPSFDENIVKRDNIQYNVASINFNMCFNNYLEFNELPLSWKSLKFILSFNGVIFKKEIQPNLTFIGMGGFNRPLVLNLFPYSITSIIFRSFDQIIPSGYFYNHNLLKSLEFKYKFNQIIPLQTLPISLTSLDLGIDYNRKLNMNALPMSLSTLKLRNTNYQYTIEKFPPSITSLSLGSIKPILLGS